MKINNMRKLSLLPIIGAILAVGSVNADTSFKDSRGKNISLEKVPIRIVALASSAPIIYSAVSQNQQSIVSITNKSKKSLTTGLYSEFFPYFKSVPADAAKDKFVPNVEAILKHNPDLIFQWGYDPKITEPLERVGLKVATWACCTNEDRESTVLMSGEISGKNNRAKMIINIAKNKNSFLKNKLSYISNKDRVTMLEIDKLDQGVRIVAKNSVDYSIVGMNNLGYDEKGEWWKTINLEHLYSWNPEMIIIPAWAESLTPEDFYKNDLLSDLLAVKNHSIYKVPLFNRSPDASENYLTVQWLSYILYPEVFAKESFITKVREAYKTIYDVNISDEQYSRIMQTKQNKINGNYLKQFGLKNDHKSIL